MHVHGHGHGVRESRRQKELLEEAVGECRITRLTSSELHTRKRAHNDTVGD